MSVHLAFGAARAAYALSMSEGIGIPEAFARVHGLIDAGEAGA